MSIISEKIVIGIDFDNTIVIYDHLFVELANKWYSLKLPVTADKKMVRDILRRQVNGEMKWQGLQTEVYGKSILQAKPSEEFITVIEELRKMHFELKIVSHKTEFANTDKTLNLRAAARNWLHVNGIINRFIPEQYVFFESTRAEKIERITRENCNFFIDDLIEVYSEKSFPEAVIKLLFSSNENEADKIYYDYRSDSWIEIMEYIKNESGLC